MLYDPKWQRATATFMAPAALGISDVEFESLVKVLGMLEGGEIKHVQPHTAIFSTEAGQPNGFNMEYLDARHDCGTSCCTLGWARHVMRDSEIFRTKSAAVAGLFCMRPPLPLMGTRAKRSSDITPDEAAVAVRNYLTTGQPNWEDALKCQ